jgi:hypothetical protein
MQKTLILSALLPLVASAALQHTVPLEGKSFIGYPFYPETITPGMAVSPEFIPGAVPIEKYNPRLGTQSIAAMWGTIDAYFQRAIVPYLWRNQFGWDKTVADGLFSGRLETVIDPWVCAWMWEYGHMQTQYFSRVARDFTNDCRRLSMIYTTLTNTVWSDVHGLGRLYDVNYGWTSSRIPDIMFKIDTADGWGDIETIFTDRMRRRYAFAATALDWRDLNTISDYPGGAHFYRDYGTEDDVFYRILPRLPRFWDHYSSFSIVNDILLDSGLFELSGKWYQNAAGEAVKFSSVLTGIAPGLKIEDGRIRRTPRIYWNQFAFANAYMAALDVQYIDWTAFNDAGPILRRRHECVTGSEKAILANANTTVEITVQNNKVIAIADNLFDGGTVEYVSSPLVTNSFTTTDINAGRCLTKNRHFSCYGTFSTTLEKSRIRALARKIPADSTNVWNVSAVAFTSQDDEIKLSFSSMIGDVYIESVAPVYAPNATFPANVSRAGATAIIEGWVITPEGHIRYLDRPWEEGVGWDLYDKYSIRSSRPHPITERWMREAVLNQFDYLVTATNRTVLELAYRDFSVGLPYSDDINDSDGWVKFACDSVAGGSISGLEQDVVDRQSIVRNYVVSAGSRGLLAPGGLQRMKTFNGREAEAVARACVSELDLSGVNERGLILKVPPDFQIQRTGSGDSDDDFIFTYKGKAGPIRDIPDGLQWSFSVTRSFSPADHLSQLAISRNFARHLFIFWNFPAMSAGSM